MTDTADMRLRMTIKGRVHGVGFRAFVLQNAANLGVSGWVRNTYRGDVEVVAKGPRPTLERLFQVLEVGPRSAHVASIDTQWEAATGEFDGFRIVF